MLRLMDRLFLSFLSSYSYCFDWLWEFEVYIISSLSWMIWMKLRHAHRDPAWWLASGSSAVEVAWLKWGYKLLRRLIKRTRLSFSAVVRLSGCTVSGYLEIIFSFLNASCSGLMQELVTSSVCSLQPISYTALQFSSCSSMYYWYGSKRSKSQEWNFWWNRRICPFWVSHWASM